MSSQMLNTRYLVSEVVLTLSLTGGPMLPLRDAGNAFGKRFLQ